MEVRRLLLYRDNGERADAKLKHFFVWLLVVVKVV